MERRNRTWRTPHGVTWRDRADPRRARTGRFRHGVRRDDPRDARRDLYGYGCSHCPQLQAGFEFAAAHLVPAIYEYEFLARDGGLTAYGPDGKEWGERVADLVDRILKGAKPADMPFEQPTRFRFVINLKTAKALGLTLPPARLAAADEVIGSSRGGKR